MSVADGSAYEHEAARTGADVFIEKSSLLSEIKRLLSEFQMNRQPAAVAA
jgi:hypothetical protein